MIYYSFYGLGAEMAETTVLGVSGFEKAWMKVHELPQSSPGLNPWTNQVKTIFVPSGRLAWAGPIHRTSVALLDSSLVGYHYTELRNIEKLRLSVSTNQYPSKTSTTDALDAEFAHYAVSRPRRVSDLPYTVVIENLLGPTAVRGHADPKIYGEQLLFDSDTWPSKMTGVEVEGTNLVITIEFGTNTVAKFALDKTIKPVWATTNGVSIGPIPTNCVFYSAIVSNKVVNRVVY